MLFLDDFLEKKDDILNWIDMKMGSFTEPFYCSLDMRESPYKTVHVDCNVFPAGFNNLCRHDIDNASLLFDKQLQKRHISSDTVILFAEYFTRNTFYWDNVKILQDIIEASKRSCFVCVTKEEVKEDALMEPETSSGLKMHLSFLEDVLEKEKEALIIANHDLTLGVPQVFKQAPNMILPHYDLGWYQRKKSTHFEIFEKISNELAQLIGVDPWFLQCIYSTYTFEESSQVESFSDLADQASDLFRQIKDKYKMYRIDQEPVLFLKANSGTFGMGVTSIKKPKDILQFNMKQRNNLVKGKFQVEAKEILLQEGVPSLYTVRGQVSEVICYYMDATLIGTFLRVNEKKGIFDNLNSRGMYFMKMCGHSDPNFCCPNAGNTYISLSEKTSFLYQMIGLLANMTLAQEEVRLSQGKHL